MAKQEARPATPGRSKAATAKARGKKPAAKSAAEAMVRQLRPEDLDAVVAIDRQDMGRSRRVYFEKRLQTVQQSPNAFITLGVDAGGALAGYVIARLARGEFGGDTAHALLDSIGVDRGRRGKGLGRALMAGLDKELCRLGARELLSQTDWSNRSLLKFFAAAGFELAPVQLLERPADQPISF